MPEVQDKLFVNMVRSTRAIARNLLMYAKRFGAIAARWTAARRTYGHPRWVRPHKTTILQFCETGIAPSVRHWRRNAGYRFGRRTAVGSIFPCGLTLPWAKWACDEKGKSCLDLLFQASSETVRESSPPIRKHLGAETDPTHPTYFASQLPPQPTCMIVPWRRDSSQALEGIFKVLFIPVKVMANCSEVICNELEQPRQNLEELYVMMNGNALWIACIVRGLWAFTASARSQSPRSMCCNILAKHPQGLPFPTIVLLVYKIET